MAGNIRPSGDGLLVGSFTAAAAISRGQLVFLSDNGEVTAGDRTTNPIIGVALEDAASGGVCTVVRGYCLVKAGDTITVDGSAKPLVCDADGFAIHHAADFTTAATANYVVGQALSDAADGDLFPAYICPVLNTNNFN